MKVLEKKDFGNNIYTYILTILIVTIIYVKKIQTNDDNDDNDNNVDNATIKKKAKVNY